MKVLITGASGRLGEFVIRELAAEHSLVLMSRRNPPDEFAHLPFIQGDLNNFEDCQRAVEGVDAIQHLGAQPNRLTTQIYGQMQQKKVFRSMRPSKQICSVPTISCKPQLQQMSTLS